MTLVNRCPEWMRLPWSVSAPIWSNKFSVQMLPPRHKTTCDAKQFPISIACLVVRMHLRVFNVSAQDSVVYGKNNKQRWPVPSPSSFAQQWWNQGNYPIVYQCYHTRIYRIFVCVCVCLAPIPPLDQLRRTHQNNPFDSDTDEDDAPLPSIEEMDPFRDV
jgi:hypothetical protein